MRKPSASHRPGSRKVHRRGSVAWTDVIPGHQRNPTARGGKAAATAHRWPDAGHRRRRHRSARPSSTSWSSAGAGEIVVLDNFVRGRRENLDWAEANGTRHAWSTATSATARSSPSSCEGIDVVFHQAAIRITQCAEEPRLALEVLVDGTFNVVEAAVGGRRAARWSPRRRPRSTGWPSEFPTGERHHPYANRHALRRGEGVQRGPAAQLPRDDRARLRRAALLQRLRPADGRLRRLHRGAGPLDGADRRRASRR